MPNMYTQVTINQLLKIVQFSGESYLGKAKPALLMENPFDEIYV